MQHRAGLVFTFLAVAGALCATPARAEDAGVSLEDARISLRGSDLPLLNVLSQISRSAGLALVLDRDVKTDSSLSPAFDDLPLSTALEVVLSPLGYSHTVEPRGRYLRISGLQTRTFKIALPIVVQAWEAAISNEASSAGSGAGGGGAVGPVVGQGGGGLGARVSLQTKSDTQGLWGEVDASLQRIVGEGQTGASYSVNRVAGFVTVRAPAPIMSTVASYFEALNTEMGRTVEIETKVLQVDLRDNLQAGVDWRAIGQAVGGLGVFEAASAVTSPPTGAGLLRLSGRGGEVFFRALEEQGELKLVAQPTLVLGNNLPAIIEVGSVQAYVSQQTTTVGQIGGLAQISVQTASINDGLTLSILPRLMDDGEVTLAVAAVAQDILQIRRENFGGGFVELPHAARRAYSGMVRTRIGESVVVGGLISDRKENRTEGLPFLSRIPIIGLLFGEKQKQSARSELIITITPRKVERLAPPPPSRSAVEATLDEKEKP